MSDDLNTNAEYKGKHNNEEDPILVAQRYLNIYHQIHIFNKRRQDEFNKSLLDLPSNVKMLLSTLPGGSVLLDHITELEEKEGMIVDSDNLKKNESSQGKRSKTRMAEAEEKHEKSDSKSSAAHVDTALSNTVMKMLKQSEEKHEKDMKALTDAFLQSQENMANILREVLQSKSYSSLNQGNGFHKNDALSEDNVGIASENDIVSEQNTGIENKEGSSDAILNNEKLTEKGSDKQNIGEKNLDEDYHEADNHDHSKLFNLTRRIFGTLKEKKQLSEDERTESAILDDTPVSLDDIEQSPVSLDVEEPTVSLNPVSPSKPAESDKTVASAEPIKSQMSSKEFSQESIEPVPDTDDDWEWEYVDDEDEEVYDDTETSDDDWEYIEIPQDEIEDQVSEEPKKPREEEKLSNIRAKKAKSVQKQELIPEQNEETESIQYNGDYSTEYNDQYAGAEYYDLSGGENAGFYSAEQGYADIQNYDNSYDAQMQDFSGNDQLLDRFMNTDTSETQNVDYGQEFENFYQDDTEKK